VLYFGTMGCILLGLIGVLTGIWADKFDHGAAVTNFVIQPLTLLSGTFYAIDRVNPTMALLSHANPFFYVIDGFRFGFLGVADGLLLQGALVLLGVNIALWWASYRVIKSGWRLKA
ncbi:MAG: ABC transporter permease, partial [Polymorphobacter sp.]